MCVFQRLRGFKLTVDIPSQYHQRLIGKGGSVVNEMRKRHDVQISFPRDKDPPDTITIVGHQVGG